MAEEQKEKWQGWLALSMAIVAVMAALTTLYMGKYSSRTIMAQGQESDQWAFYQAKSIKQHSFEMSIKALELQSFQGLPTPVAPVYEKTLAWCGGVIERFKVEKKDMKDKAVAIAQTKLKAQEIGMNFA